MKISTRWQPRAVALAAVRAAAGAAAASENIPVTRISTDPFPNSTSQHATELEPDTFSHHGTTISTFQVGRFFNGGASDIGWSRKTSTTAWTAGFLPGTTLHSPAPHTLFERGSDPTLAHDAHDARWVLSPSPPEFTTLHL